MVTRRTQRVPRLILGSATAVAMAVTLSGPASAAGIPQPADGEQAFSLPISSSQALSNLKVSGPLAKASGEVSVFVQLKGDGAFETVKKSGKNKDTAKVKKMSKDVKAKGKQLAAESDSTIIYTTHNALQGVALTGDAEDLRKLAERSDVAKISSIVPKKPSNRSSVVDTGALESWKSLDKTGKGIKVAVLDTGVDYTHASFGGPGTLEAYKEAQASTELPSADSGLRDDNKFIGGWDLVGDDYNANSDAESYQPIPHPDPNPLDCEAAGHGSHVAGTTAGYGVNADGSTFTGNYADLDAKALSEMKVGPGSAPEAQLIGIRVFGCEGSSSVVGQALDYVLDPNGDGDFSDRAQVVNMSLGSDHSPTEDPENDIVDELTKAGILSVVASGNAGDVTDVGGSPGNSRSSLTVANSVGSHVTLDKIQVDEPSDVAGTASGQYSSNFNYTNADPAQLTGEVVMAPASNEYGCDAFEAGSLEGKWVWLKWSENGEFPCGSAARFNNAEAAGATGVILDSEANLFDAGIAGNSTIPGAQFTLDQSQRLRPAAEAGTLKVTLSPDFVGGSSSESGAGDTLNSSSSRGVHGSNGVVKPDVAAPGTQIGSVGVGTGTGTAVMSGTSMATPLVAGIAALVLEGSDYTPYEAKSLIMNTAATDIKAANGEAYGPNRVGAGRVMADAAIETPAFAYDSDAPDLTSVVFGVIELDGKKGYTAKRKITLQNTSDKTQTYNANYVAATQIPGASYSLDRKSVTVKAGKSAQLTVTLKVDPKKWAKTIDPTMATTQSGLSRAWLADATGRVELTSSTAPTLRVPVQAAPKLVADMSGKVKKLKKGSNTTTLDLKGKGITAGEGATEVTSLLGAFELGASSDRGDASLDSIPAARSMDLQYVGASSTAGRTGVANGQLNIGISTWENWAHLAGGSELDVEIDTNADGKADFVTFTTVIDELDLDLAATFDLATGKQVDLQPVNGVLGDVDTNTYDTNTAILPVSLSALGLSDDAAEISYRVLGYSWYNTDDAGSMVPVDQTDWINFNAAKPQVDFGAEGSLFTDLKGNKIPVTVADSTKDSKALLLHLHNASEDRAQVLDIVSGNTGKPKTK
ncbi:S8 family serine peptidase [Arthrobacter sp. NIO-1057]|uniref:S8 family serine peptidase n=1 Tax=Arthrobacter sp. NIO-1057 TaxID=993071 RepID=UPI00071CCF18|nr:S8 family serine peptidase [Arthrobacter sp. NIO-1057]KSU65639.1 subtilase [Arthrobacter sp. NIO-1057]SCC39889.1 PA domain-containing protein [Arthrobacter sp. NIO-1057]